MAFDDPLWLGTTASPVTYASREDRALLAALWDEGVFDLTALKVTQRGAGANMSVDVAAGIAIVQGDDQASPPQWNYLTRNDGVVNVAIGAGVSNPRIDLVTLRINDPAMGGQAGNSASIVVVAGTPAASPVAPALPNSSLLLATVGPVSSGTGSITNSLITDGRTLAGRRDRPGTMELFAGTSLPNGWLLCNGQAVSRTTYAALFAALGTVYGAGNGSTTFNLPDLRDRVPIGVGTALPTAGALGGASTHTLTTGELPAHSHGVTDPGHAHDTDGAQLSGSWDTAGGAGGQPFGGTTSTQLATTGITTNNAGGGGAHNNMQPYQVIAGWLIRT